MAKKKFLEENNEQVWPITRIDCVYTIDGQATINRIIDEIEDSLEDKQDKEDANLNTEDKTIVGAINEVKTKKVDKVEGKDLIDIDEINRLSNVDNYDDSEVRELIDDKADINKVEQVNSKVDLVASKVEENTLKIEEYAMIEESDIDLIIADLDNE